MQPMQDPQVAPARSADSDATTLVRQGVQAHAAGNDALAEVSFRKATQIDPGNTHAHFNLGALYEAKGDYTHALESYNNVLKVDPNDDQARMQAAKLAKNQFSLQASQNAPAGSTVTTATVPAQLQQQVPMQQQMPQRKSFFSNHIGMNNNFTPNFPPPMTGGMHLRLPSFRTQQAALATSRIVGGAMKIAPAAALLAIPLIRSIDDNHDRGKVRFPGVGGGLPLGSIGKIGGGLGGIGKIGGGLGHLPFPH